MVRKLKKTYETAKIDVIPLPTLDILTTSGDTPISTGGSNMTENGWTTIDW